MYLSCTILAVICDIAAIKDGDTALYRSGEHFTVTGHVIAANAQSQNITFWNCPDAIVVRCDDAEMVHARRDVLYRLEGRLNLWKGWKKQVLVDRLVPVATNSFPVPIDSSPSRIMTGGPDCFSLVRLEGTIVKAAEDEADPKYCWLTLKNTEGTVSAFCRKQDHAIGSLTPLVGARVRLVGVSRESVTWRSNLPRALMLAKHDPIEVVEKAETDPKKLPSFSSPKAIGRQRVEGVVVARTSKGFYLNWQKRNFVNSFAFVAPVAGCAAPDIGRHVVVAGFADYDAYHLKFDEALVETTPPGQAPAAAPGVCEPMAAAPISSLFIDCNGQKKLAAGKHGELVRLRGTVRDMTQDPFGERRIVIEDGGCRADIDATMISAPLPEWIRNDAVIDVAGVLTVEYEPAVSAYALPRFVRFTILPRSTDDFSLVRRAPWWTPRRLFAVILVLSGVIVLISIWNRALRRLSAKRGEELYKERIAHAAAKLKIEERTRLAVEIHDSISQTLTGIALQFDNGADESVVRQMLSSCRHELKCCLWDLRSRTFEEKDMTEAIKRAIGPNAGNAKVDVRFNVPRSDLSETTTHAILRIVRELVVNAVRHGKATEVKVAGECHDGTISFSVRDNGSGFDPSSVAGPSTGHFGLQGVRERLGEFQGEMTVESSPGKGARISVSMKMRSL